LLKKGYTLSEMSRYLILTTFCKKITDEEKIDANGNVAII